MYIIIHSECIITRSIHMYNVGVLYNSMGIYNNKQCKILKVYLIFIFFTWSALHSNASHLSNLFLLVVYNTKNNLKTVKYVLHYPKLLWIALI